MVYMYMETLDVRIKNRVLLWLNSYELYERPLDQEEEKQKQLANEAAAAAAANAKAKQLADEAAAAAANAKAKQLADEEAAAAAAANAAVEAASKSIANPNPQTHPDVQPVEEPAVADNPNKNALLEDDRDKNDRESQAKFTSHKETEKKVASDKANQIAQGAILTGLATYKYPPKLLDEYETKRLANELNNLQKQKEGKIQEKKRLDGELQALTKLNEKAHSITKLVKDIQNRLANDKLKQQIFDRLLKTALSSPYSGGLARYASLLYKNAKDKGSQFKEAVKKKITENYNYAKDKGSQFKDAAIATSDKIKEAANYIDDSVKKSAMNGLSRLAYSVEYKQFNVFEDQPIVDYIATKFNADQKGFINEFSTIMPDIYVNGHHFYTEASFNTPPTVTKKLFDENAPNIWFDISNNEKIFAHFESVFDNQIIQQPTYDGLEKLFTHETRGIRFDLYFTILSGFYPDKAARKKAGNKPNIYEDAYRKALKQQFDADFDSINADFDSISAEIGTIQKKINDINTQIGTIETEIKTIQKKIDDIKTKIKPNDEKTPSIQNTNPSSTSNNRFKASDALSAAASFATKTVAAAFQHIGGSSQLTLEHILAKLYILYRRLKPYLYFISKIDTESDISSAVVEDKKTNETIVKRQHQLLIIPYTYRIVMRDENNVILTESFVHATKQVLHVIKVVLSEDTEPVIHYMMFKPPNNTITKSPPPKLYTARVEPILPVPAEDAMTNGLSREDVIQQNLTKMNENTIQEVRETNLGIHESYVFANVKDYKEITTGKMVENCQYIFGRDDLADVYKHIPSFIRKTIGDIQ